MSDQQFTLGKHIKIEGVTYLAVRFVRQSTFHEETTTGDTFIDQEEFVEARNKKGEVRFFMISQNRVAAQRDPGPCKGIKPYYWKGPKNAEDITADGGEGDSGGDSDHPVTGEAGSAGRVDGDNLGTEQTQADGGQSPSPGNRPVS